MSERSAKSSSPYRMKQSHSKHIKNSPGNFSTAKGVQQKSKFGRAVMKLPERMRIEDTSNNDMNRTKSPEDSGISQSSL